MKILTKKNCCGLQKIGDLYGKMPSREILKDAVIVGEAAGGNGSVGESCLSLSFT